MIIGIDAGTSFVKAAAFSDDGQDLAVSSHEIALHYPEAGYVEQHLDEIVAAVGTVVKAVADEAGTPDAIGITGQGDGLWLFDDKGHPVRPGISWLDARASSVIEEWIETGVLEKGFRINGNAVFPGSHAPLLAFLSDHEPDTLNRATTAGYCKDAILQRLTGVRATDASDASMPFLDVEQRTYNNDLLTLYGVAAHKHLLAPVDDTPGPMRSLNAEGARLTDLPEGTPVHNGPYDIGACALGAGVRQPGDALVIIGTTLACEVLVDELDLSGEPAGSTICTLNPDHWIRLMPAMVGTASLDLALDLIRASIDDVEELLGNSPPGANGVSVLPFFSAAGERAPFVDTAARGQIMGMDLGTTRADVARAICEGVGYAARHCLTEAGLPNEGPVTVTGGGSKSAIWRQILADVLQRPVYLAPTPEVGARGAALAAMIAAGMDHDYDAWTQPEGVIEPQERRAEQYAGGYAYYLERLAAARTLWKTADHISRSDETRSLEM